MILLIQLLKFLENNKKAKIMLQAYFESSIADVDFGEMSFDDIAEQLPEFLANHLGIELEMKEREKESLVKILKNGTWKSAFAIQGK